MFPNYNTDDFGMNKYTKDYWVKLRESNLDKFEDAHMNEMIHATFPYSEVI